MVLVVAVFFLFLLRFVFLLFHLSKSSVLTLGFFFLPLTWGGANRGGAVFLVARRRLDAVVVVVGVVEADEKLEVGRSAGPCI